MFFFQFQLVLNTQFSDYAFYCGVKGKRKKKISNTAKNFSKNLKHYRILAKWDQNTLAKESEVSLTYTCDVENEKREVSLDYAQKFAKGLNIELQKMLEERNDEEEP